MSSLILNRSLLKVLMNKENFDRWNYLLNKDVLSNEMRLLLNDLYLYYRENDEFEISNFITWFQIKHSTMSKTEFELFTEMLMTAHKHTIESSDSVMRSFYEMELKHKINDLIQQDRFTRKALDQLLSVYDDKIAHSDYEELFNTKSFADLFKSDLLKPVFTWKLPDLNLATRGLFVGDLVIVSAPINTGKSAFLIDTALHCAKQTDKTIYYLSNEEETDDIRIKLVRSALIQTKRDREQITPDISLLSQYDAVPVEKKEQIYNKIVGNKIQVLNITNKSIYTVLDLCKKLPNPGLVIIDLASELGIEENQIFIMMNKRAKKLKDLAKEIHVPILGAFQGAPGTAWTTQSGDTAVKKWLHYTDAAGSKGVAGPSDVFIGLGQDKEVPNMRYLWVSKTRKSGDKIKTECLFLGEECSYLDLGEV